ncbi:MAG: AI-2E family transporter [Planctomycetota bacterium]|jgi:predicted PurR-regulated permease PerM
MTDPADEDQAPADEPPADEAPAEQEPSDGPRAASLSDRLAARAAALAAAPPASSPGLPVWPASTAAFLPTAQALGLVDAEGNPQPLFSSRRFRVIFLILISILVLLIAYRLRAILNPFLLALLLAYVLDPVLEFVQRNLKVPRLAAIALLLIAGMGTVGGVSVYLYARASRGIEQVVAKTSGGYQLVVVRSNLTNGEPAPGAAEGTSTPDGSGAEGADLKATDSPDSDMQSGPVYGTDRIISVAGAYFLDLDGDGAREQGEPWLIAAEYGELEPDDAAAAFGWRRVPGSLDRIKEYVLKRYQTIDRRVADQVVAKIKENGATVYQGGLAVWTWLTGEVFGGILTAFSYLFLVPIYLFFLLRGFENITVTMRRYLPGRYRTRILMTLRKIDKACAAFFRGRFMLALGKGLVTWLLLWAIGVDLALFIGLLAGMLSIVPFLGPVIGLALAVMFSYTPVGWVFRIVMIVLAFGLVEVLEALANPLILGREVGLHPVTIVLAFLAFGELFGVFGVLLAIPLAAIIQILVQEFVLPELRELAAEKEEPIQSLG